MLEVSEHDRVIRDDLKIRSYALIDSSSRVVGIRLVALQGRVARRSTPHFARRAFDLRLELYSRLASLVWWWSPWAPGYSGGIPESSPPRLSSAGLAHHGLNGRVMIALRRSSAPVTIAARSPVVAAGCLKQLISSRSTATASGLKSIHTSR